MHLFLRTLIELDLAMNSSIDVLIPLARYLFKRDCAPRFLFIIPHFFLNCIGILMQTIEHRTSTRSVPRKPKKQMVQLCLSLILTLCCVRWTTLTLET